MNSLKNCLKLFPASGGLINHVSQRNIKRYVRPTLIELTHRKKKLKTSKIVPEPENPRNTYLEWNRDAELFAFNNRLSEKFDKDLLEQAFTHRSYVVHEEMIQKEVGIDEPLLDLLDNRELIEEGQEIASLIIDNYVSQALPLAPQECILAMKKYLLSTPVLSHTSSNIGTKDLILSKEHPVNEETLANTLYALISALKRSVDLEHAGVFVRDILIAQLAEKDFAEIWIPDDPVSILNDIMEREGRPATEPRIINHSGLRSEVPVYQIGVYSNKELLGTGFGETPEEGTNIAAFNALLKMFGLNDSSNPFRVDLKVNEPGTLTPLEEWCKLRN